MRAIAQVVAAATENADGGMAAHILSVEVACEEIPCGGRFRFDRSQQPELPLPCLTRVSPLQPLVSIQKRAAITQGEALAGQRGLTGQEVMIWNQRRPRFRCTNAMSPIPAAASHTVPGSGTAAVS